MAKWISNAHQYQDTTLPVHEFSIDDADSATHEPYLDLKIDDQIRITRPNHAKLNTGFEMVWAVIVDYDLKPCEATGQPAPDTYWCRVVAESNGALGPRFALSSWYMHESGMVRKAKDYELIRTFDPDSPIACETDW